MGYIDPAWISDEHFEYINDNFDLSKYDSEVDRKIKSICLKNGVPVDDIPLTQYEGYVFATSASSDTEGLYLANGTDGDYSDNVYEYELDANTTYLLYSGNVGGNKYWFVGTEVLAGDDAYTQALYRTTNSETDPDGPGGYTGVVAPETGRTGTMTFQEDGTVTSIPLQDYGILWYTRKVFQGYWGKHKGNQDVYYMKMQQLAQEIAEAERMITKDTILGYDEESTGDELTPDTRIKSVVFY